MIPALVQRHAPHYHIIPTDAFRSRRIDHSDMYFRNLRHESRFNKIGLGIGAHGMLKEGVVPPFLRPFIGFPPILDRTPIGDTDHPLFIHIIIRLQQVAGFSLTLEQDKVRPVFQISVIFVRL